MTQGIVIGAVAASAVWAVAMVLVGFLLVRSLNRALESGGL